MGSESAPKICTVTAMVSDMDAAVDFYTGKLGLNLKKRYGEHYAEIEAPGLLIGLHPDSGETKIGDNLSIGFGVEDFDGAREDLEIKGISFRVEQDGPIRLAHFADPDGNQLYLAEMKRL